MIKNKVKEIYEGFSVKKWGHVKRVLAFATKIADSFGMDDKERKIVQISALVHDIGYKKQFEVGGKDLHGKYSVEMVDEIFVCSDLSKEEIELVKETISTHSIFEDCHTKFQKIIFDADKLEKITFGEIIRKSIIMHGKFSLDDEQIFFRLMEQMKGRMFHFDISKKIASENLENMYRVFNHDKELFDYANDLIEEIDY